MPANELYAFQKVSQLSTGIFMEFCPVVSDCTNVLNLLGFRCNFGVYKGNCIQVCGRFLALFMPVCITFLLCKIMFFDKTLQVDRMDDKTAPAGGARYLNTNQHFHIGLRTLVPAPY